MAPHKNIQHFMPSIRLDEGNIDCSIFVNLQKAFDTAEHSFLSKLEHYGISGLTND